MRAEGRRGELCRGRGDSVPAIRQPVPRPRREAAGRTEPAGHRQASGLRLGPGTAGGTGGQHTMTGLRHPRSLTWARPRNACAATDTSAFKRIQVGESPTKPDRFNSQAKGRAPVGTARAEQCPPSTPPPRPCAGAQPGPRRWPALEIRGRRQDLRSSAWTPTDGTGVLRRRGN